MELNNGEKLIMETKILLNKISKELETKEDISTEDLCILSHNLLDMQKISINAETIEGRNQFNDILDDVNKLLDSCLELTEDN